MGLFSNLINNVLNKVTTVVHNVESDISSLEQSLINDVSVGVSNFANGISGAAGTAIHDATAFLSNLPTTILQTGSHLTTSLAQEMTAMLNSLPPVITQAVTGSAAYATNNATPTIGQFTAAALETMTNPYSTPPSLTPFMVNGKQMMALDTSSGMFGEAWETASHQIIISYMATNPVSPWGTSFWQAGVNADSQICAKKVCQAETESLDFARSVQAAASAQGIDAQKGVFTTGLSLGGIEAEYVAQQTGLGGLAISSAGLPASPGAGTGSNFVNVLARGDAVSMFDDQFGVIPTQIDSGAEHYGQNWIVGPQGYNDILKGLIGAFLPLAPSGGNQSDFLINALLAPGSILAGDPEGLNYLKPKELATSLFSDTNHVLGSLPFLLANANSTIPH